MHRCVRRVAIATAVALAGALSAASGARAYGYCGVDATTTSPCPIAVSPTTLTGSVASAGEQDYYIFDALSRTHLSLTVTDTEEPSCSFGVTCGAVYATLTTVNGDEINNTSPSVPASGLPVGQSITPTIPRGIYYVVVDGVGPGTFPDPYTLSINSTTTPAVHWPPLCTVPRLDTGASLHRARHLITTGYCSAGRLRHAYDGHVPRGRVIALAPRAGTVLPNDSAVTIVVSAGPKPPPRRPQHHRRHHH